MYDPYNFAPLWLVWGFIDQNSKMAEIVYFIIKKITNTYKISRGFESFLSGGLNIMISQFQKVYEWSSCHFVKMVIYFGKRTCILFEQWLIMIFGPTERKTGKMHLCEVVCNGVLMKLLDVSSMLKLKKESKIDEFAWTKRFKNGHSVAIKTNRFQSGFRDLKNDRKKSGFDAADFFKQNKQLTGKNQDSVPPG